MLFVKRFPLRVKGFVLCMDSGGMRLERKEMRSQFFQVCLVTFRIELRTMQPFELLDEFGVRRLE